MIRTVMLILMTISIFPDLEHDDDHHKIIIKFDMIIQVMLHDGEHDER